MLLYEIYSGEGAEGEEELELRDKEKSFSYLKMAAKQGESEALMRLGHMYYQGEGTEADTEKAIECYEKAWNAGNPMAGTMLGLIYIYGFDDEESAKRGFPTFIRQVRKVTLMHSGKWLSASFMAGVYQRTNPRDLPY